MKNVFATSVQVITIIAILFYLYFAPSIFQIDQTTLYFCAIIVSLLYIVVLDEFYGILMMFLVVIMYFSRMIPRESMTDSYDLYENAEIVVSRYKEKLDWLGTEPFSEFNHVIYNKSSDSNFYTSEKTTSVIDLPNVGKCDHTYLYHIVENYDTLKDITIFLPGSVDMSFKIGNATRIVDSLKTTPESTIVSVPCNDVAADLSGFTLDNWRTSDGVNYDDSVPDDTELADIRPFGEWFKHHFGDLQIKHISYFAIMAISKKHIHNHPKSYYESLLSELDKSSNPEVGHFFERAWVAIFHPMDGLVAL